MGASYPFFWLIDTVLWLMLVAVLVYAVMSWLIAFNVINTHNQFVYGLLNFLERITEPLLRPIRRIVPPLGGVDLSALVLLLLIQFARMLLRSVFFG